eukprot:12432277-Heterocapsa_arctica.AAC.1
MKDGRLPQHWCSGPGGAVSRTLMSTRRLVLDQRDSTSSSSSRRRTCSTGRMPTHAQPREACGAYTAMRQRRPGGGAIR